MFNIGQRNITTIYIGLYSRDPVFGLKLILKARTMMSALFSPLKHKIKNIFCYVRACFLVNGVQGKSKNVDK